MTCLGELGDGEYDSIAQVPGVRLSCTFEVECSEVGVGSADFRANLDDIYIYIPWTNIYLRAVCSSSHQTERTISGGVE